MLSWNSNTVAAAVSPGCCPAPASFSSTVLWRLSARWLVWLSSWPGPGAGLVTLCEEETDTPTTPPGRLTTARVLAVDEDLHGALGRPLDPDPVPGLEALQARAVVELELLAGPEHGAALQPPAVPQLSQLLPHPAALLLAAELVRGQTDLDSTAEELIYFVYLHLEPLVHLEAVGGEHEAEKMAEYGFEEGLRASLRRRPRLSTRRRPRR